MDRTEFNKRFDFSQEIENQLDFIASVIWMKDARIKELEQYVGILEKTLIRYTDDEVVSDVELDEDGDPTPTQPYAKRLYGS